ncbi:3-beta hydroxysteroid dehydrogenase/isomerase family-domain-containing protein [Phlyctochytrium arcticum]|nr:3-beta hydroxysteroid dehydrogenase/isomerase family-domain-containing protein [Phlyctochytrium arcticum]
MVQEQSSVLVIGGGGFLGQAIISALLKKGHSVSAFDLRKPAQTHPDLTAFHVGDITDPDAVRDACRDKTVVIHTAAVIEGFAKEVYWAVNVGGTQNVIDACKECGVRVLVYTSSASVTYYGQDVRGGDESDPYCEIHMDSYNETKAAAEQLILAANDDDLCTVALRPAGIFGPADHNASKGLVDAARKGNWKVKIGDNTSLFDWTYVDNVAHAHVVAAETCGKREGVAGQVFYITNDSPVFFWDVPKYLWNALGYKNTLSKTIPRPLGLALGHFVDALRSLVRPFAAWDPTFNSFRVKVITSNRWLDITRAKEVLGYRPIVTLEEGLRRTAEHWREVMLKEGWGPR